MATIKTYDAAASKIEKIAELNDMTEADVVNMFMEFADEVCEAYRLKQYDWEV
jgi:hypothetical protein